MMDQAKKQRLLTAYRKLVGEWKEITGKVKLIPIVDHRLPVDATMRVEYHRLHEARFKLERRIKIYRTKILNEIWEELLEAELAGVWDAL